MSGQRPRKRTNLTSRLSSTLTLLFRYPLPELVDDPDVLEICFYCEKTDKECSTSAESLCRDAIKSGTLLEKVEQDVREGIDARAQADGSSKHSYVKHGEA